MINERVCYLKIKSRWFNSTLINVHAPPNDKSEEVKNEFYYNLEQVVDKLNSYEIKILLGDCNGKIGKEPIFKHTVGLESLHEKSNDNATCLIQFATSKEMNRRNTTFPHRNIHKETWYSPDGNTANQINHVLKK